MTTPAPQTPQSAADQIAAQLAAWGLSTLAPVVNGYVTQGLNQDQMTLSIQQTDAYKARFSGNTLRAAAGLPVLSPSDYLNKEDSLREQFRLAGLPPGFYDQPDDFAKAIGSDLGAQELSNRLAAAKAVVMDGANTGVLAYAKQNFGLGDGDLLAYFIDPDRAAPVLTTLAQASQIGADAARTGFGNISGDTATRLANQGISDAQAQQGFSQAAGLLGLADSTGDSQGLTRDDLQSAVLDQDAAAQQRVTQKQGERKAGFQGGGGYATGKQGISGLGTANT